MKHTLHAPADAQHVTDVRAPLVTVVIVNYNYAGLAAQCMRSVTQQDYPNIQCLIVECASTDDSAEVIEQAIARQGDTRFKLLRRETNRGHLANALTALDHIEGVFTVFLDADDFLFPGFISAHVAAHLNDTHSAAVSVSDQVQVDMTGQVLAGTCHWHQKWRADESGGVWREISDARSGLPESAGASASDCRLHFVPAWWSSWPTDRWIWATTSAMMFRSSIIAALAPQDSELNGYGPLNLDGYFARIAHSVGGTLVLDAPLGAYRRHGLNFWSGNPVFGGQTATSAVDEPVRTRVLQELAGKVMTARHDDLIRSFGGELYYSIVWQLMSNEEFFDFVRRHPSDRPFWEGVARSATGTLPPDMPPAGPARWDRLRHRARRAAQRILR